MRKNTKLSVFRLSFITKILLIYTTSISISHAGPNGDLDIYSSALDDSPLIMIAVDTSGSMLGDVNGCYPFQSKQTLNGVQYSGSTEYADYKQQKFLTQTSYQNAGYKGTYSYNDSTRGCNFVGKSRLEIIISALTNVIKGSTSVQNVRIGLVTFDPNSSSTTDTLNDYRNNSGRVLIAAEKLGPLGSLQRKKLLNYLDNANLKTKLTALTPSAFTYGEAAAYLLGGNTSSSTYNGINKAGTTITIDGTAYNTRDDIFNSKTSSYKAPSVSQCNGNGIYFVTDGYPNNGPATDVTTLMNLALSPKGQSLPTTSQDPLPLAGNDNSGWSKIGDFAKVLNSLSPRPIRTAVVAVGADFDTLAQAGNNTLVTVTDPITKVTKTRRVYNCEAANINQNARNACLWGTQADFASKANYTRVVGNTTVAQGGFGEGGFTVATGSDSTVAQKNVEDSLNNFITDVTTTISTQGTGTIVIPQVSLSTNKLVSYALVPQLSPQSGTNKLVWPGNVKKYTISRGIPIGGNSQSLFNLIGSNDTASNVASKDTAQLTQINKGTYDLWSSTKAPDNNEISVGGVVDKLPVGGLGAATARNVYVALNVASNDLTKITGDLTALRALTFPQAPSWFQATTTDNNARNAAWANRLRGQLLNLLGYNYPFDSLTSSTTQAQVDGYKDSEYQFLGGVLHSDPVLVTYKAAVNSSNELVSIDQESSILFGSMDGGLHIVNADTGIEQSVFYPYEIIANKWYLQTDGFRQDAERPTAAANAVTVPSFGMDGPWTVNANYSLGQDASAQPSYTTSMARAYGGMRLGGRYYYGLNIDNPSQPLLLFKIGPEINGFKRMGFTFGKPLIAYINYQGQPTKVMIVGGGYDRYYDRTDSEIISSTNSSLPTLGNAIYIVNAETGVLLYRLTSTTSNGADTISDEKSVINDNLIYPVVGQVRGIDRDNDGLIDHLYFADLGGQIFRVDIDNTLNSGKTITRVIRLADLRPCMPTTTTGACTTDTSKPGPRFYEAPAITIQERNGQRFAAVSIASGDRSNPTYIESSDEPYNRVFTIMDLDITRSDLFRPDISNYYTQDITLNQLVQRTYQLPSSGSVEADRESMVNMSSTAKRGWYFNLERFDVTDASGNLASIRGLKAFNPVAAIANDLYVSVYNPAFTNGTNTNNCSASVKGGSEIIQLCLPYGDCSDKPLDTSNNRANIRRFFAGGGIQAVNFGSNSSGTSRRIIYDRSNDYVTDRERKNPTQSGLSTQTSYDPSPVFTPTRWFDLLNGKIN